jgi:hypothetical protein
VFACGFPLRAFAQQAPAPPSTSPAPAAASASSEDDEATLDPAEPDFVLVNLPTTLRLPEHKGNFRLTHRFAGNLLNGSFSEQASNLFGLDQGALIGFEYRFAVVRHVEAAAYRGSFDKTIQLYSKYDAFHQNDRKPLSLSGLVSVEGTNNFQEQFATSLGVSVGRTFAKRAAAYAVPMWVGNSNASLHALEHSHGTDAEGPEPSHPREDTFYIGVGGRVRVLSSTYLVGEFSPRVTGYRPDNTEYGFGVEERVGGHVFSLTFTNTFGTTFAQLARGGTASTLYLGFNLARKFF